MKQQFLKDTGGTFQTYIYDNNQKIIPTSATLTVYNPGSSVVLIDGVAMTVGGDGLLSYAITAANNLTADENYKAVVAYVFNTVTYTTTLFYDVVRAKLHKVITDEDIIAELPQLKDNGWRVHGDADSGSTTTIVDAELTRFDDDYFTGGTATSLTRNEVRAITNFVGSTGTVTTPAFTGVIATDKYILTRSYESEINRAFEKIEAKVVQQGKRPHLILDPCDLREVHIYTTVAEICKGNASEAAAIWWEFWQEYEKKAHFAFKDLNFKYDESEDGIIVKKEEDVRMTRTTGRG